MTRREEKLLGYAWASVSYCPSRSYTLITVYFFVEKEDAEAAKANIDASACGGSCRKMHRLEYLPIMTPRPRKRRNPYTGQWDTAQYIGNGRAVKAAALPGPHSRGGVTAHIAVPR